MAVTPEEVAKVVAEMDATNQRRYVVQQNVIKPSDATQVLFSIVNYPEATISQMQRKFSNADIRSWPVETINAAEDIIAHISANYGQEKPEVDLKGVNATEALHIIVCGVAVFPTN